MIVAFVLVFSVNMVSLVALNQNMKTMADQIVDYATVQGTTDIGEYISTLKEKSGINFSYSFSGTDYHSGQKVQLGDVIEVRLTYRVSILGFGDAVFPITVKASARPMESPFRPQHLRSLRVHLVRQLSRAATVGRWALVTA